MNLQTKISDGTEDAVPVIAIVGHPNKGKSSIVSTLSHDGSVCISAASGTTTRSRSFPMVVDGHTLYRLVDTPGFQRPRHAIDWMQAHSHSAADHRDVLEQFVTRHEDDAKFDAECELLKPIIEGAGILYVVDGSVPYGAEYEAEMEILRWTGQPSMALINQIGETQYFESWRQPLSQYFRIVREFNAQTASFERQTQLLSGFAELSEHWRQPLEKAVTTLRAQRESRLDQAAAIIASALLEMLTLTRKRRLTDENDNAGRDATMDRFKSALRAIEGRMRADVEALFQFADLDRDEAALALVSEDLFSDKTWQLFGLSRDQLLTPGIVGGAAGGSLLDLGSGGMTMLLGTGLGALVGGASAWLGGQQLVGKRILGLPIGGNELVVGPVRNVNFPWIALARAVTHLRALTARTHARRDQLSLHEQPGSAIMDSLGSDRRKQLQRAFQYCASHAEERDGDAALLKRVVLELIDSS